VARINAQLEMAAIDEAASPRPRSRLTARVRRDAIVDQAMLRGVVLRGNRPEPAEVERVADEVDAALALFGVRGWDAAPATYHREPPPATGTRERRARSGNVRYTSLTWPDGYEVRADEPGAERYAGYGTNRIARAALLEHRADAPWILCVHGFGMGTTGLDVRAFRALHLHRTLGLNVAFLTLPFHGRRRPSGPLLPKVPGVDVLDNLHAMEQAVWDVRQLLALLRSRTEHPVGVMGLSLGGLVSAVVASIDEPHAAVLLVPAVDLTTLMADAAARLGGPMADGGQGLIERSRTVMGPVSPLVLEPRVPTERLAIVAGTLDKFARPSSQAVPLWRHWGEPEVHWYHGGHVSLFWSNRAKRGIDRSLARVGLTSPTP
jgi:hypothetical protein